IARWMEDLAESTPAFDTLFLESISRHWLLHRVREIVDWMLPEVAGAIERLDRALRRGRLDTTETSRTIEALELTVELLRTTGRTDAARQVAMLIERARPTESIVAQTAAERLLAAGRLARSGDPAGYREITTLLSEASPTSTWTGPTSAGRGLE